MRSGGDRCRPAEASRSLLASPHTGPRPAVHWPPPSTASRLPGSRIARPADIANAISYLIEDDFVTGTVLHVEGGQLLV
jgi:NAD(P)-dependent dehydrogenase (short-subunit alcohol dehydrogenase family)